MRTRALALTVLLPALISASTAIAKLPPIRNVFIIILENKGYNETFGSGSPAVYLSQQLTQKGQLLRQYYATGHVSLDNYVSLVSGQAPNSQTQGDCQIYADFVGGSSLDANGQVTGQGCVYPAFVHTIADQLTASRRLWKGYMQDMENGPGEPATCRHPQLNSQDNTQMARMGDQYATRHNPFVYFHSIIDSPICDANVVPLTRLATDLQRRRTTPSYAFITPNLCEDGHDAPCVDGRPGGLASADLFLQQWVPLILSSRGFRQRGLLIIAFDEGEISGSNADSSACCNEPTGPNTAMPGIAGPGGGRVGAVLISRFIRPGSVNDTPYNHYSLLRSIEDLFGLGYLGYAGQTGLVGFGSDVYNCYPRSACR